MKTPDTITVTDALGRSIEIRKLKPLDQMRILELVGAENSANDRYLGFAGLAYCVTKIDDDPVGRLGSKLALEGVVQELGDEGLDAVGKGVKDNFLPKDAGTDLGTALKNE